MQSTQKTEDTEKFFNQWAIYQRVIDKNYMMHEQVAASLQRFLQTHSGKAINFLDLGCGDAYIASKILPDVALNQYCGIDLSDIALQFARSQLATLGGVKLFVNQDLSEAISQYKDCFDVISAGYSLHHLKPDEKQLFFNHCARALKPDSYFLMYDLVRLDGESRQNCLDRHWRIYRQWDFSEAEFDLIKTHVFEQDNAESSEALQTMANNAGFKTMETLFVDQQQLFGVYCFGN